MKINIAVIQPSGYVHSLGFLDYAEYFIYHLKKLGYNCSIKKNRLDYEAVNLIFGAHLSKTKTIFDGYNKIYVNLENLQYLIKDNPEYIDTLRHSDFIDYDPQNLLWLGLKESDRIFTFSFGWYQREPNLTRRTSFECDLLFYGSLNERRRSIITKIQNRGLNVTVLAPGIYYRERDDFILKSRAVLNCHFYEQGLFEQARAFVPLSLGVPVISERPKLSSGIPEHFKNSVVWFDSAEDEVFNPINFESNDFRVNMEAKVLTFRGKYDSEFFNKLVSLIKLKSTETCLPSTPRKINLGSGKDYLTGWLNVDVLSRVKPDVVMDLSNCELPIEVDTSAYGRVMLAEECFDLIYANNVLEHIPELVPAMTNCLKLLRVGGKFLIEVPYERALGAWQDPTHLRAFNEYSFVYYCEWFWYLGWSEYRFTIEWMRFFDLKGKETAKEQSDVMRICLQKVALNPKEKAVFRTMDPSFGLG